MSKLFKRSMIFAIFFVAFALTQSVEALSLSELSEEFFGDDFKQFFQTASETEIKQRILKFFQTASKAEILKLSAGFEQALRESFGEKDSKKGIERLEGFLQLAQQGFIDGVDENILKGCKVALWLHKILEQKKREFGEEQPQNPRIETQKKSKSLYEELKEAKDEYDLRKEAREREAKEAREREAKAAREREKAAKEAREKAGPSFFNRIASVIVAYILKLYFEKTKGLLGWIMGWIIFCSVVLSAFGIV